MTIKQTAILTYLAVLFSLVFAVPALAHPHILDMAQRTEVSRDALLDDLRQAQVILVGESHDHLGHHKAQLSLVEALAAEDRPLAVGLEMFRQDSQQSLDLWTADQLPLEDFLKVYNDNWSMWPAYRDIFMYARTTGLKMVGLNIGRNVTAKVARHGFKSLSSEDRQMLGNVQCEVDPAYAAYLRLAVGSHGGQGMQYLYFCEAQLIWDNVMADRIVAFLKEHPDFRLIVLTGSSHAWKFGIPKRILEQAEISYRVILPEVIGRVDRVGINEKVADYLWLDFGDDGWSF